MGTRGGWSATTLYLIGMALVFVGERLVGDGTVRLGLTSVGLLMVALSLGLRLLRRASADDDEKAVHGKLAMYTIVGILAVGLWAFQGGPGTELLDGIFTKDSAQQRMRGVLGAVWPIIWLLGSVPMIFVESSFASMAQQAVEKWRIQASARSGLVVVLALGTLSYLNYIATELEWKQDVSYQKRLMPSETTQKIVKGLGTPVEITLFYPPAHDVAEDLMQYFSVLDGLSSQIQVRQVDHALEPALAKKVQANANGVVILSQGDKTRLMRTGLDEDAARKTLSRLDQDFQKELLKLTSKERIAYFTTGHGERHWMASKEETQDQRAPIADLKTVLERLNYKVKELGLAQGLGSELPDDATVVFIVGPEHSFLANEVEAVKRFFKKGGRLFVFADPESEADMNPLLASLGVKMDHVKLAHERQHANLHHNDTDRYLLFTNSFSSHPSASTLSRMSSRMAVVMLEVGSLEEVRGDGLPKASFTLRSLPETFADLNGNAAFDSATEKKRIYDLTAAVSMKRPGSNDSATDGSNELRAIVMADSDVISDTVFRNAGNAQLVGDGLNWLVGDEELSGEMEDAEDIKIIHTKDDDVLWFWGTIFGVPILVLVVGLTLVRRRRATGGAQ